MRHWIIAGLLLATAACGKEAPAPVAAEAPRTLPAGEYEVVSEVTKLASIDKSVPATKLKLGTKENVRACVAADGTPDPKLFVETGDECTVNNNYGRSGRLSVQYSCQRAGNGILFTNADGNFTADGFEAVMVSSSSFAGSGDYSLTRHLTAKRLGACPAALAKG